MFVRLKGPDSARARRQMDRCGDRRAWRSARRHPRELRPCPISTMSSRRHGGFSVCRRPEPEPGRRRISQRRLARRKSARRLFAMSQPIAGTLVETYLRKRGITIFAGTGKSALPSALLLSAGSTVSNPDLAGDDRRRHRSRRRDHGRASHLARPSRQTRRRSTRRGGRWAIFSATRVRFGVRGDVMAAGEGIETMLSLRCVLPDMPMAAALSAAHLAAILFPATLRRLYIARDKDPAGDGAAESLIERANAAGIEAIALSPRLGDFNEDLRALGVDALRAVVARSARARGRRSLHGAWRSVEPAMNAAWRARSCRVRCGASPVLGEDRALGLLRGRSAGKRSGPAMAAADYFPSRAAGRLCIAKQNSRPPPSSAALRPCASLRVQVRSARRLSSPGRPRWARSNPTEASHEPKRRRLRTPPQFFPDRPCPRKSFSSTAIVPSPTSPIRGRLPEARHRRRRHRRYLRRPDRHAWPTRASNPTSTICSGRPSISSTAPPTGSSANSTTTSRRSGAARANRMAREVRSVELERLTAEGQTLIERRNAFELMRDQAADHFERHTGSSWRPRAGSMVNHRTLTSAMIDSREFLAAKRRAETEVLLPAGPKIAFSGGRLQRSQADLGQARQGPRQASRHGAAAWRLARKAPRKSPPAGPTHRKVPQIAFKPDWTKHAKAAPFKRNDQMLDVLPIGVIVFPGTGIQDNLCRQGPQAGHSRSGSFRRAARERRFALLGGMISVVPPAAIAHLRGRSPSKMNSHS